MNPRRCLPFPVMTGRRAPLLFYRRFPAAWTDPYTPRYRHPRLVRGSIGRRNLARQKPLNNNSLIYTPPPRPKYCQNINPIWTFARNEVYLYNTKSPSKARWQNGDVEDCKSSYASSILARASSSRIQYISTTSGEIPLFLNNMMVLSLQKSLSVAAVTGTALANNKIPKS